MKDSERTPLISITISERLKTILVITGVVLALILQAIGNKYMEEKAVAKAVAAYVQDHTTDKQ